MKDNAIMHTLACHGAVQGISLDKQRLSGAPSMSFQDVDSFHGILDVSSHVDRPHGKHGVDSHRRK